MSIHLSSFLKRQTAASKFAHWTCSDTEFLAEVERAFNADGEGNVTPGYREGVLLVKIGHEKVKTSIVNLYSGDGLAGGYESRQADEEPRKSYWVYGKKQWAVSAFVVLYSHAVLVEGRENETDEDWEAICLIATPDEVTEPPPMDPDTLIANHFVMDGGTSTKMTDAEFVSALRKSVMYWKDKTMCSPVD